MLDRIRQELRSAVAKGIRERFGLDHDPVVEIPPRRELGDFAFPAGLHLARVLKRSPRAIAEELAASLELPASVREARVEGAGYLNLFLDRGQAVRRLLEEDLLPPLAAGPKVVVEHTNINPNKAAHIGHLRNAVLGDVLARVLRRLGHPVEVQNYIDDTGVQVADVVVGFHDLRGMTLPEVAAVPEPFDYVCWDLYAEVGRWYEDEPAARGLRTATLHELEAGQGERARIGRLIAARVVARHLATMARLGVRYDLLTHESAILGLDFFAEAFELLEKRGAIRLEEEGKNAGCWVMPLADSAEFQGLEDADKVIVRSDGTITYVGKDIAYQLWKFGLLARDFNYRFWDEAGLWQTAVEGTPDHPPFGHGHRVINVIDSRQSYLQKIVRAGLEALGYHEQAARSVHFAYEFVSLSAATAREFGFLDPADGADGEDGKAGAGGLEMSGRRGIGVKADDLLDRLRDKSREEISARNRELAGPELDALAGEIATAAIRFFMVKATTTRIIAFDVDEALSFEGESGPYLQYSMVRARNIWRKLAAAGLANTVTPERAAALPAAAWTDDLWDLVLAVAQTPERVAAAGATLELSLVARHALDLAQKFNAAYHKHPILQEEDADLRDARLAATRVFARGQEALADLLGVPLPERM
ncbi:MAG: arginine--tRNA ligase [Acidobacteriota bacterium]|nr:arginine--tRNA ligase [Acidobacteriota bacterium]MDH3522562.1 arginine--tRNA ligase [Acidobacteriota bacterium]